MNIEKMIFVHIIVGTFLIIGGGLSLSKFNNQDECDDTVQQPVSSQCSGIDWRVGPFSQVIITFGALEVGYGAFKGIQSKSKPC